MSSRRAVASSTVRSAFHEHQGFDNTPAGVIVEQEDFLVLGVNWIRVGVVVEEALVEVSYFLNRVGKLDMQTGFGDHSDRFPELSDDDLLNLGHGEKNEIGTEHSDGNGDDEGGGGTHNLVTSFLAANSGTGRG